MISDIIHVGVTVSNIERSIAFYRDVLGLKFEGQLTMEGPATDRLFGRSGAKAKVAYLKNSDFLQSPPVELIQFVTADVEKKPASLFTTSISEICFKTDDIWDAYNRMTAQGVEFLSEPQEFDFTGDGFGKSLAVYFKDPDNIIMELMQPLP